MNALKDRLTKLQADTSRHYAWQAQRIAEPRNALTMSLAEVMELQAIAGELQLIEQLLQAHHTDSQGGVKRWLTATLDSRMGQGAAIRVINNMNGFFRLDVVEGGRM